ncbi:nuclear transport factor 2 family protein [Pseudonocardia aurantiaca]
MTRTPLQMSDAKTLLEEFLRNFRDPEKASALFVEDGAFEMPFFVSLGLPTRFEGREGVKGLIRTVLEYYPDFEFKDEDITVHIDTPDQVFAEYVAHTTAAATGRLAHHLFMGRLVAENGQIRLLRESLNTVAMASALLPGGVHDLPEPASEVHAF